MLCERTMANRAKKIYFQQHMHSNFGDEFSFMARSAGIAKIKEHTSVSLTKNEKYRQSRNNQMQEIYQ